MYKWFWMVAVLSLYHTAAVHVDLRSCLDILLSAACVQRVNVGANAGRTDPLPDRDSIIPVATALSVSGVYWLLLYASLVP
jgi:hypothetical protein